MRNIFAKLLGVLVAAIIVFTITVIAGTLDNAPFRIVLPNKDWKLSDSVAQPKGDDVYLMATVINTNTGLISWIAKADIKKTATNAFDEFCGGMRDSFSKNHVKVLSDEETLFLGYKARRFSCQPKQANNQITYNETIVFVVDNTGWTIGSVGWPHQSNEVRQSFEMFQKNEAYRPKAK